MHARDASARARVCADCCELRARTDGVLEDESAPNSSAPSACMAHSWAIHLSSRAQGPRACVSAALAYYRLYFRANMSTQAEQPSAKRPEIETGPAQPRYGLGVTIGKFYPLHQGHALLISQAAERCDHLVVICSGREAEPVDMEVRASWIRTLFPSPHVEVITTPDDLPEAPQPWATRTLELLAPRRPDVVLTAEAYGDPWATLMGCAHVQLNTRITSGTELRADLGRCWEMLTPPAKAHFCKRVAVIGVESSGTTTLAQALAEHYQTAWVPEYGRFYWEGRRHTGDDWQTHEFVQIARGQHQLEDDLAHRSNRVLICDTDALATHVWHRRYVGSFSDSTAAIADERSYSLYILTTPDFEFVQDGTRDGEAIRHEMHGWMRSVLEERASRSPYIVVTGGKEARLKAAVTAIDELLTFPILPLPPAVQA